MAVRTGNSQIRQLYVGTGTETSVADGNAIITGSVGIGVTTAGNKLSVAGNIQATNNGVDISDNSDWPTNIIIGNSVYPTYIKAHRYTGSYSNGLDFYYSDASSGNSTLGIRLNSNGLVGIGTDSPSTLLHIKGNDPIFRISNSDLSIIDGQTIGEINFNSEDPSTTFNTTVGYIKTIAAGNFDGSTNSGGKMIFGTYKNVTGLNTAMAIDVFGNVGIGTDSPGAKLQVDGGDLIVRDSGNVAIQIISSNSGQSAIQFGDDADANDGRIVYMNDTDLMRFFTNDAERISITSTGGISFGSTGTAYGTSGQILKSNANASPTWVNASTVIGGPYLPLTAGASYPLTDLLKIAPTNTSGSQTGIELYDGGGGSSEGLNINWSSSADANTAFIGGLGYDILRMGTGGAEHLRIDGSGNVGIGTISPTQKLQVDGVIESPYLEYKPFVFYDFNSDTVSQWGVGNATLSTPSKSVTRFTTTGTDANLNRNFDGSGYNSPPIPGGQNQIIRIRYKWISGTAGSGEIFYATSGHGYSGSYYKTYNLNTDGEYHTLVLDMSNLNSGGTDWVDNDITAIRFDLINITPVVIDIDWISVGGNGWGTQYFENDVAFMNGKVGIGTTSPAGKLHVQDTNGGIFFDGSGATYNRFKSTTSSAAVGRDLLFSTQNSGTTPDLYINSSGNVGIGTASPSSLLSLGNAVDAQKLLLYDTNNNFKYGFGIQSDELRQFFPNSATSRMVFGTISDSDGSTFSEKMRITSAGGISFGSTGTAYGTSGQVLTSAGNASPTWTTPTTGDITAVVAGSYLTGGGTSGSVTLNGDNTKLAHIVDSANASVTSGWITVAEADTSRRAGEIYVTDGESGDHSYIRIEWMRSYADSNFTVINCGGHANRIQGVRVLQQTSDATYGPKYLQVKVTSSSNYYVIITAPGTIPNYGDLTAVTPILEDTKTGYSLTGAQLEDLQDSSIGTDEGITVGGDLFVNGGDIVLGGTGRIQGVDTVSATTDAANKAYVDAHGGGLGPFLPLTAGSSYPLTGDLFIEGVDTPKITLTDTTNNLEGRIRVANSWMYIEADDSNAVGSTAILLKTDGVEALRLDANQNATFAGTIAVQGTGDSYFQGNVGIGTTSPGNKLHVENTVGSSWTTRFSNTIANSNNIYFGYNNGTTSYGMYIDGGQGAAGYDINTASGFTVRGDGKVGIGTTTPGSELEVDGEITTTTITYPEPVVLDSSAYNGEIVYFGSEISMAAGKLMVLSVSVAGLTWYQAKDSGNSLATGMLGIALGTTASAGLLVRGIAKNSAWSSFSAGQKLYLSPTNGAISNSITVDTNDFVRIVGYALGNNKIYFCPDNTYIQNA